MRRQRFDFIKAPNFFFVDRAAYCSMKVNVFLLRKAVLLCKFKSDSYKNAAIDLNVFKKKKYLVRILGKKLISSNYNKLT